MLEETQRSDSVFESDSKPRPSYLKDLEEIPERTVVRERFGNKREILLTFMGYIIGPANVWRFPYLVLKNGGVAFIFMYLVVVATFAYPLGLLELTIGQYSGKDAVNVWDMNPAFRGVGFSMCLISLLLLIQYHIFMEHCLYYAVYSFQPELPWATCKPEWKDCLPAYGELSRMTPSCNTTTENCTCTGDTGARCRHTFTTAAEFYYSHVLQGLPLNGTVDGLGTPSWERATLLMVSWMLVIFCTIRGIRSTTKILYVTVLCPFAGLLIMLALTATVDGSTSGLEFLFNSTRSHWQKLGESESWMDATSQAFLSLKCCVGTLTMLGSYSSFNNRQDKDFLVVVIVDTVTSLVGTVAIFLTLGHAAYVAGADYTINDLFDTDLNLAFIAYPFALSGFPMNGLLTFVFFIMLYTLAIDTEFGFLETILAYLQDDFRIIRRHNVASRILLGVFAYLLGFFFVFPKGHELTAEIDESGITLCMPIVGLFETIAVMWSYGAKRFIGDLEYMLSVKIKWVPFFTFIFSFFVPISLLLVSLTSLATSCINDWSLEGNLIIVFVFSPIVIWFCLHLWRFCTYSRNRNLSCYKFVRKLMRPLRRWGPNDGTNPHRTMDTVFADIFPSLRRQRPKMQPNVLSAATAYVDKELEELFGSEASTFFDGQIMTTRYSVSLHDEDEADDDPAGGRENQAAAVEEAIQGSAGYRKSQEDAGDQADQEGQATDGAGIAVSADEDKIAETGDETRAVPADPTQPPSQSHGTDPNKPLEISTILN